MTIIAALALGIVTPSPEVAQALPAEPPPMPSLPYISELSKSGLTPEMFDRPVKAKANLVSLFSTEDYPLESIRNREAGTVAVVLRVGKDGRLIDCLVEKSSGFPALDSQTCRILWLRARFIPARNNAGMPVESGWRQRIRWELPEPDPIPFKPWSIRIELEFVSGGGVLACNVESSGAIDANEEQCKFFSMMSQGYLTQIRSDAGYERKKMVMETEFSPGRLVPKVREPSGLRLLSRQVGRLTVSETGKALNCEVIETEGPQPPIDDCSDLLDQKFEAPGIKVGAVEAIVARNLFVSE